jgi:hypothetical protein
LVFFLPHHFAKIYQLVSAGASSGGTVELIYFFLIGKFENPWFSSRWRAGGHYSRYTSAMAKTETIETPDELKNQQRAAIEQRDRFIYSVAQSHKRLPSRAQARLLKRPAVVNSPMEGRGSLFKYLAPFWRGLTTEQKQVWRDAGVFSSITNWQLFISDNAARIRNSLALEVPPSELWQVRTGRLLIEAPASEIILKQEHPQDYYVSQKITGTPWKSEVVNIVENFSLPLELQFRYKSDLTAEGGTQVARYFARVWSGYQGQDIVTDLEIPLSASTDWTLETVELTSVVGHLISYTLFLEISGYRGEILFDNIRALHGGSNWARDPRCDDITKTFVKGFALVPPFWIPVSLPSGASFSTVFPPAL